MFNYISYTPPESMIQLVKRQTVLADSLFLTGFVLDRGKGIILPTSTYYPQKAQVLLLILGVLY